MKTRRATIGALLLALACGACSSDSPAKPDVAIKPDQGAADLALKSDQALPDATLVDSALCSVVGKWKGNSAGDEFILDFRAGGKVDLTFPTKPTSGGGGNWTLKGDKLEWDTDRTGCDAYPASYTITFSADCNSLTFTLVKDTCTVRVAATDGKTFPRVP